MRSPLSRPWRWLVLLAALALVVAACAEDDAEEPEDDDVDVEEDDGDDEEGDDEDDDEGDDEEAAEPTDGGTVLFGDEQEPTILNGYLLEGNSVVTSKVFNNQFLGAHRITPDFEYEPVLVDGMAEISEDPFTVTYTIKDEATWSDGEPIDVEDFVFTWETVIDEDNDQMTSREGYEDIEDYETDGDKTITFEFSQPYAPWALLFDNLLPEHVLAGEDFQSVMNDELPDVGSGPFLFDSWDQGSQLRLVANEDYWDGDVALDEIVMRYVPDTTTLTQQMRGGEIDMYDPQPQIELIDQLDEVSDRINSEVGLGPVWEHIDFNTLVDGLDEDYVRQAIALGIDRETIVETLINPVDPDAVVLQNPIYMANQEQYEEAFASLDHDPEAAQALLEDNGCEQGDDGIYECDGTRLSFRLGTTGGNERRELTQQLIQSDLADVGIEITIENDEGAAFFDRLNTPEACDGICDYDIAMFAWVGSPDPTANRNIYACDFEDGEDPQPRPQNWTVWCDEEASALMDEAAQTVDPDEQAALWNEVAEIMSEGAPIVPLFQQPQLLAWDDAITGPQLNATNQTQFWNSDEWALTE
ncbi:MAG: ABC transporter family substrate-binding protein [Egibacteraceae bacterium]